VIGQKKVPTYYIQKISEKIKIDGIMSESVWFDQQRADSFYVNFPIDTIYTKSITYTWMCFDDNNIYIAARCIDTNKAKFVAQSLRRDFSYPRNDAFGIYIDPLRDLTNGFNFTVTPLNVQREGIISNTGNQGVTTSWDNKWYSAVSYEDSAWICEFAIPFKSIRYDPNVLTWGINFSRHDLKINENSSWGAVPRNFNIASLNFAGILKWTSPPPKAGKNLTIIPYTKLNSFNQKQNSNLNPKFNVGGDFKVGITSSLNLDGTVNSDFSEADVDDQVINLDRFSIFFPERRTFFQENSDLFSTFGFSRIRPFFSRNIGLFKGQVVPLYGGLRLSGKLDKNWRIGVMSVQTKALLKDEKQIVGSQNFTVVALQRQVGKSSNISALFVNKQGQYPSEYNRVLGLDYNLQSSDGKWKGKAFYHYSFTPTSNGKKNINSFSHASWLNYTIRNWSVNWNHEYVGKDYKAEVGFVPRTNYWRLEPVINYYFFPKSKLINRFGPQLYESLYTDMKLNVNDHLIKASMVFEFSNSATAHFDFNKQFLILQNNFNASGSDKGLAYLANEKFDYQFFSASFTSNFRKKLFFDASGSVGEYYSGKLYSLSGNINYRIQPFVVFGVRLNRTEIQLPNPYTSTKHLLVGPKIDLTLSRKVFMLVYSQYNTQQNNFNTNFRLQYRFRPMSDVFLVYGTNYKSEDFSFKDQSIILKVSWWLNL